MRNTPFLPVDPTLCSVDQRWPSDPPPTLGQDLSMLAWLENSRTQLSTACSNYLCGALLEWSLLGELWPDPLEPTPGPDCDHLVALVQLTDRLVRRIADALTVEARFDLALIGRELSNAIRAQRDPQGLVESRQRELLTRMPRLTGPPPSVGYTGGRL